MPLINYLSLVRKYVPLYRQYQHTWQFLPYRHTEISKEPKWLLNGTISLSTGWLPFRYCSSEESFWFHFFFNALHITILHTKISAISAYQQWPILTPSFNSLVLTGTMHACYDKCMLSHRIRCLGTGKLELSPVHYWFIKEISV